jgi:hypothetical protein
MKHNAHDALFKETFTDLHLAASLWQEQLPAELVQALDWNTLQLAPTELLNEELQESELDLLYHVRFRKELNLQEEPVFLYLLYEQQSTNQRWMNVRLLKYQLKRWELYLKEFPKAEKLPLMLCLVLHHGPRRWTGEVRLLHSYQLPSWLEPALQPYLVDFTYLLDNLSAQSPETILKRTLPDFIKLVLLCLKYVRYADTLPEAIEHWKHVFQALVKTPYRAKLVTILHYLHYGRKETTEEVHAVVTSLLKAPKDIIMTSAEQLIQRGRDEAKAAAEQLIQQGKLEGELKGKAGSILAFLKARKLIVSTTLEQRILACQDDSLLTEAVVLAATCDTVAPVETLFLSKP